MHPQDAPEEGIANRIAELLEMVRLQRDSVQKFPHECSSGQRQRIAIARALAVEPEVSIADELVSTPSHPYSQALLSAAPSLDPNDKCAAIRLEGETVTIEQSTRQPISRALSPCKRPMPRRYSEIATAGRSW